MKVLTKISAGLFFIFCINLLHAHEGHDHAPVSMKSAIEIGLSTAAQYTNAEPPFAVGKLPRSWAALQKGDASIHENGRGYYVVAINNSVENKILYLKILLNSEIDGANFTGNF